MEVEEAECIKDHRKKRVVSGAYMLSGMSREKRKKGGRDSVCVLVAGIFQAMGVIHNQDSAYAKLSFGNIV